MRIRDEEAGGATVFEVEVALELAIDLFVD
jgi:hypothetical protein